MSAYGSFHGRTLATLHATGQPQKHEAFQPLPEGFRHVAWDDLDALESALDPSVAAVLLEPVQGEGGVNPATVEYFTGVRRLCDERGILFMVDEVQTGLGRTGEWFGFQHFGVRPDVVTMAKALGNGVPIGACWAASEVADAFVPGDHATTFGGQPLATAAARAVLEVMQQEDVPARAKRAGELLTKRLLDVEGVAGVRGLGLLLAAELDAPNAKAVAGAALDAGLVVNAVTDNALRLAPLTTRERRGDRRRRRHTFQGDQAVTIGIFSRSMTSRRMAAVLDLARMPDPPPVLAGEGVALLFEKPSLRTRNATELAVFQLGGHPLTLRGEEVGLAEREPVEDLARTLSLPRGHLRASVRTPQA